ncbi:MAG: LytR C-terminal domain-containing protein [Gemmatimonadales bacterium]
MRRITTLIVGVAALAGAAWWVFLREPRGPGELPIPGEGERVTVEVLNATHFDGLARETTRLLRRHGIDVVHFGTARGTPRDTTLVVVRRGDTTRAVRVRDVLGVGSVVVDPDDRLLLDVSVLLGTDAARSLHLRP